jgi:ABC-type dipeptide/oligopeptide/nickel transport system permease component
VARVPRDVSRHILRRRAIGLLDAIPGFFRHTWKALGHTDPPELPDFPMLCALTVWGAVLIVVLGLLTDAVMPWLDPRIRTNTR